MSGLGGGVARTENQVLAVAHSTPRWLRLAQAEPWTGPGQSQPAQASGAGARHSDGSGVSGVSLALLLPSSSSRPV